MANWASTAYVIEGPKDTLQKIHQAILNPKLEDDEHEDWEGGVLRALNIDWQPRNPNGSGYYMRGFIQKDTVELDEDLLRFAAEEAWGATDFHEVLEKNIPDIKVFYVVEEDGEEIYATNDKDGKYFPDKFYVDTCIDGQYDSEYFVEADAMYAWLTSITHRKIESTEDVDEFNGDYEDACEEDENYIHIYKFEIVN